VEPAPAELSVREPEPAPSAVTATPLLLSCTEVPAATDVFRVVAVLSMVRAPPPPEVWVLIDTPEALRSTLAPPTVVVLMVVAVEPVSVAPFRVNARVLALPLNVEPVMSSFRARVPALLREPVEVAWKLVPVTVAPVSLNDMEAEPLLSEVLVAPSDSLLSAVLPEASRVMLEAPVTLVALDTVIIVEPAPSVRVMPLLLSCTEVPA
jgi:hypothetical protein